MLCHDALHLCLLSGQELVVDLKFWSRSASQNPGYGQGVLGASGDLA